MVPLLGVARRYAKDIDAFLQKLHESTVNAYEIGFVYGVPSEFPETTRKRADELKIKLSGHIPFFLSWANEEKIAQSTEHLTKGMRFAARLETLAVCHLGYYGSQSFETLKPTIVDRIFQVVRSVIEEFSFSSPVLGIETTGKKSEIGSLEEVLSVVHDLSTDVAIPVVDWAHLYARSDGKFPRSTDDFSSTLSKLENETGMKKFYFHGSGIEYRNGSEKRHLSVKTCQPPLPYLLEVLREAQYEYTLIVESPEATEDIAWLRNVLRDPRSYFDYVQAKQKSLEGWITS